MVEQPVMEISLVVTVGCAICYIILPKTLIKHHIKVCVMWCTALGFMENVSVVQHSANCATKAV